MHNFKGARFAIAGICLLALFAKCKSFDGGVRNKRTLLYPGPTHKFQAIMGAGFPVDLRDQAVIMGVVLKGSYLLPLNATDYTQPSITYARKRRSMSRWNIYDMLSQAAELYGFGGKVCVLRTICEMADVPIDTRNGIMAEMLHTLFTPTTTEEELTSHTDNEYYAAHEIGLERGGNCGHHFSGCESSFVDMFSKITHSLLDK